MTKRISNYFFSRVNLYLKGGSTSRKGLNFSGRICVHHRGGGLKKRYRLIDFSRRLNAYGTVLKIVYDPNRNAFLGLILYDNGFMTYIILTEDVVSGSRLYSGNEVEVLKEFDLENENHKGSAFPLKYMPLFSIVSNVELKPFFGAKLARAAGSGLIIMGFENNKVILKSKSGWLLSVPDSCMATLGFVSNALFKMTSIGKAGKARGKGRKPVVRGVAMNPCDHPHGGGEGKKGSPRKQKTPWGKLTKGTPTKTKKVDKIKRNLFKKIR